MATHLLLVLGASGVGKSALVHRFYADEFVEDRMIDQDVTVRREVKLDDDICIAEIVDMHCTGEFTAMRDLNMKGCQGVILAYSITSRKSFDDLPNEWEQILRVQDVSSFPVVIVGCKADLEQQRQVDFQEAQEMATLLGGMAMETSAKENWKIRDSIATLVKLVAQQKKAPTTSKAKKCIIS